MLTVAVIGCALTAVALTWLNPHVYLDTFLLIGTAGAREPDGARVAFALGAMAVSGVWFIGLGYGARALAQIPGGIDAYEAGARLGGSLRSVLAAGDRVIELTPNGNIDKMIEYDYYISDPKISELRERLYAGK